MLYQKDLLYIQDMIKSKLINKHSNNLWVGQLRDWQYLRDYKVKPTTLSLLVKTGLQKLIGLQRWYTMSLFSIAYPTQFSAIIASF